MALSQTSVIKLYSTVIEDVIAGVRDAFLDDGVDEQVLQEMKQVWTNKLMASKAVEITIDPLEPQPPPVLTNNKSNGTKSKSKSQAAHAAAAANAAAAAAAAAVAQSNSNNTIGDHVTTGAAAANASGSSGASAAQSQNGSNTHNSTTKSMHSHPLSGHSQQNPPPLQPQSQSTSNARSASSSAQHHPSQQHPASQNSAAATGSGSQSSAASSSSSSQQPQGPQAVVAGLHPSKIVPIQITLPPQPGVPNSEPRVLTIQVPASALQENQLHQVLTGPIITSIMTLPPPLASSVLQQHVNSVLQNSAMPLSMQRQLDGAADTSDDEGSDVSDDNLDGDDDDDLDKEDDEEIDGEGGAEEEPLNSDDDVSEEEHADMFETDNVIVCQYDKITRSRNKWKFYLKDGIMNIGGKDYVFQKSNGDAEW